MSSKTPVRATFSGSNVTGLAEYQSGEFVPLTHGGLGVSLSIGTAGQVLKVNGAGNAIEFGAVEAIVNIDAATDLESATLAVGDKILLSDGGTEGRVLLSQLDTLFSGTSKTLTNKTIALGSNTVSGTTAQFNTALSDGSFATLAGTETLTNKTLTSPTITSGVLNTAVSGTAVLDEDDLSSNSATQLATQQSIKAYVDAVSTSFTLAADSGSNDTFNSGETLTLAGGTGIDSTVSNNQVSFAIDSTVTTLTGSQTLTNKTLTTPTIAQINASNFTIDASGDITLNADGSIISLQDGASEFLRLQHGGSNNAVIKNGNSDADIVIKGNDGGSEIDALTLDMSAAGAATFNSSVTASSFVGALTGNVTGNVSGSSGSTTGNAATATALANARTIGGTSFDGTANIAVALSTAATTLETARTIAGQSFDGSANITIASTDLSDTAAVTLLTATQTLTNKTLTTPVIAEIDATGDFTVDAVGDIILDAGGSTIAIKDDGTEFIKFTNNSGSAIIRNTGQDKDISFLVNDGGSTITALTIDSSEAGAVSLNGALTVGGNAVVTGDLTVNGTTTTLATTNSTITDRLIELGNGTTGTPGNDMGIVFERGDSDNAFVGWDESTDKFIVGTGTFTGASTGDLTITTGTLVANLEGNVTGNVTGNADTATALANARTIAGQSFDGSANITIASTDLSNTSAITLLTASQTLTNKTLTTPVIAEIDATGDFTLDAAGDIILNADGGDWILRDGSAELLKIFNNSSDINFKVQTQDKDIKFLGNDGGSSITALTLDMSAAGAATFNSTVTASGFTGPLTGNADTATTLANARTIAGVSFDGSANIAIASTDLSNTSNITLNDASQTLTNKTLTDPTISKILGNGITLDAATDVVIDGGGTNNLILKDDGTTYANFTNTGGNLIIKSGTTTALTFSGANITAAGTIDSGTITTTGDIVFEGATADGNETTLTVVDPTADRTITFQNGSGTVAFLTDVTGGATPGNFTTITLDNNITFEGATDDAYETTLTVEDPTADRTVTIPNATGQIVLRDTTDTLTNKTLTSPVIAAITSTGDIDLTATNDVNIPANVGLTFGDDGEKIEGDGTNLTISSSNTFTVDSTNSIFLKSAQSTHFRKGSTNYLTISDSSSDAVITAAVQDKDIIFKGDDGGSAITALTLDMSDAGAATFNSNVAIGGNATVTGNLTVNGTTTTLATTNSVISDRLIELGNGTTGTPGNDMGIVLERGDSDNAFIGWDESTDKFIVGTGTFTGASTGNLTITTGTLVANLEGNVTGNVTGNVSGTSGSTTGNAATATALETARTIAGQSFDGTGNITIASTDLSNTSNITLNDATQTLTNKALTTPIIAQIISSGNIHLDAAGDVILDAEGADVILQDGGTEFGRFTNSSTDFVIKSAVSDKDIIFKGNDGGVERTSLTLDMSDAGTAIFGNNVELAANKDLKFGTSTEIINGDGTDLNISSGSDVTIDAAAEINLDAGNSSIRIKDDGTEYGRIHQISGGGLVLKSQQSDKDIQFQGNDGGSAITALTLDMSAAGAATFNSTVTASGFVGDVTGDVTGNADTATTLATARTIAGQSFDGSANITIASTDLSNTSAITLLTATQTLTNKTLTSPVIDTITRTGDFTLDVSGDIILDADDAGQIHFKDGGTQYAKHFVSSNNYNIESTVSDGDILFKGSNGGSTITALTIDMSDAGAATFNSKAVFGGVLEVTNGTNNSRFDTSTNRKAIITRAGGVEGVGLGSEGGAGHSLISMRGEQAIVGGNSSKGLSIGLGSAWSTVPASSTSIHLYGNVGIGTGTSDPAAKLEIVTTDTNDTLLLTSTEASSTASPVLTLKRNSGSVADADYLGQLKFKGENDNDEEITYAKVTGKILDASDGTEDGLLEFSNIKAGSQVITARLRSDSLQLLNGTSLSVAGDATITGDLTVNGTTTTVSTTNTVVSDTLLELGNGSTGTPGNDSGIVIERGSSDNAFIGFDESDDKFKVGTGSFTGASTGNLTITTGTLVANIEGNVTGNVTGNVSGSAGSATGNAATATALETARNIGGVSFDGSANIDLPGVNSSGNQDTSGNAATATILANARTIAGQSFNGSANITIASTDLSDTASIATLTGSQTLTNKSIDSDNNTITNIVNADIKSSAAIAFSKMADLTASRALASDSNGDVSVTSVTATELGYLDGVSSAIQTQLDAKHATIDSSNRLNANLINDGTVDNTEFGYLNGVTSAIQTQIDNKATKGFAIAMAIAL